MIELMSHTIKLRERVIECKLRKITRLTENLLAKKIDRILS